MTHAHHDDHLDEHADGHLNGGHSHTTYTRYGAYGFPLGGLIALIVVVLLLVILL